MGNTVSDFLGLEVVDKKARQQIAEVSNVANEANAIAKGASKSLVYGDYQTMITSLNAFGKDTLMVGWNLLIVTINVPDLWVSGIVEEFIEYVYVSDEQFVTDLEDGTVQVGYYVLSPLETQKVPLDDYLKKVTDATGFYNSYGIDAKGNQIVIKHRTGGYNGENMVDRIAVYTDENLAAVPDDSKPYKGTLPVNTPKKDYHAVPKKYVDDMFAYKTLVDVTLDDTNSNTSGIKVELPLEKFMACRDFTIYAEIPTSGVEVVDVWLVGRIEDANGTAYSKCVLYNQGKISNTGKPFKAYSNLKILNGCFLSMTSYACDYEGANTASSNMKSMIDSPTRYSYETFPPYLKFEISNHTFPAGTRIIMEGR